MKHTPGTWIACEDDEREGMPFIPIVAGTETEPYLVAQVEPDMDEATQEFYISERTRANANLIAAAPDLYDALVRIYEEATGPAARHRETPKIVATIAMTAIESAGGGVD